MTLLDFRKPKCVVLESVLSHSGKYKGYYGHHYVDGGLCYDVGSINQHDGEIITRHYGPKSFPNPKAAALTFWHEFRAGLEKAPQFEETDENKPLKPWIQ